MIKVIIGKKGSGKTKTLVDGINKTVEIASGDVVFISTSTQRHIYDISHKARMIDTVEYNISSYPSFYGFICGIASQNYDISNIYIDSLAKIAKDNTLADSEEFFEALDALADANNIEIFITISIEESEVPEFIKQYI